MKDGLRFVDCDMHSNVSNNLLCTVPRDIAAQIFMGGAHLYGFTDADFQQADAVAAKRGKLATAAVNG